MLESAEQEHKVQSQAPNHRPSVDGEHISHHSVDYKENNQDNSSKWDARLAYFKRHVKMEFLLLKHYWKWIVLWIIVTYVHSPFTKLAYYLYNKYGVQNQPLLEDLGFKLFGKLDDDYRFLADMFTYILIGGTVLFGFTPFFVKRQYYGAHILNRYLASTCVAFVGRIVAFSVTLLPAPADHCRGSSPDYDPPTTAEKIILTIDVVNGCADLIFSSHTTYCIVAALVIAKYGKSIWLKLGAFSIVITNAFLIVALHNHWSVDVWLALYINPFVFLTLNAYWPDTKPEALIAMEKEDTAFGVHGDGIASQNLLIEMVSGDEAEKIPLNSPVHRDHHEIDVTRHGDPDNDRRSSIEFAG